MRYSRMPCQIIEQYELHTPNKIHNNKSIIRLYTDQSCTAIIITKLIAVGWHCDEVADTKKTHSIASSSAQLQPTSGAMNAIEFKSMNFQVIWRMNGSIFEEWKFIKKINKLIILRKMLNIQLFRWILIVAFYAVLFARKHDRLK